MGGMAQSHLHSKWLQLLQGENDWNNIDTFITTSSGDLSLL